MKQFLLLAVAFALTPLIARASDPALFRLSAENSPVVNGKVLNMVFQEIERKTDSSTVQIARRSGGSVSSSMFVMRGMCGLARSRSAQYFVPIRIVGEESEQRYTVTFPKVPPESGKGFTIAQCALLQY